MLALVALAAGCGGGDEDGAGGSCAPAAAATSATPELPDGFPKPSGVTYTSSREAGPSTIVEGYREGDLGDVFEAYRHGFEAAGYDITKDEREEEDAEVNFAGGGTDGQVKLRECEDRTSIEITVRPA
jgi:hypothetical protein